MSLQSCCQKAYIRSIPFDLLKKRRVKMEDVNVRKVGDGQEAEKETFHCCHRLLSFHRGRVNRDTVLLAIEE
jgi:hypothetical protein